MTSLDVLMYVSLFVAFAGVVATAANDAAVSFAGVAAAATTNMKSALLLGAGAACAGILLLDPAIFAGIFDMLLPLATGSDAAAAKDLAAILFAVLFATAAAAIAGTWFCVPAPILPAMAASMFAVSAASGRTTSFSIVAALIGLTVVGQCAAAGMAFGLVRGLGLGVLKSKRPRDRFAPAVAAVAGVTAAVGVFLAWEFFNWARGVRPPLWSIIVAALVAAGVAAGAAYWRLRSRRFSISNDAAGVESGFRRSQIAGAFIVALVFSSLQCLAIGVTAAACVATVGQVSLSGTLSATLSATSWAMLRPIGDPRTALILLVGAVLGVMFGGNRTLNWLGDKLLPMGPVGGIGVNGGIAAGSLAATAFGFPPIGGQVAVGAMVGVGLASGQIEKMLPHLLRYLGIWLTIIAIAVVASLVSLGLVKLIHL